MFEFIALAAAQASAPPFVVTQVVPPPVSVPPPPAPAPSAGERVSAATTGATRAKIIQSREEMVSADDYPFEAIRNEWQGFVAIKVDVSPAGSVSGCHISRSSGHPILDARTCAVAIERWRFHPARNARGDPVASTVSNRIAWRLPAESAARARAMTNAIRNDMPTSPVPGSLAFSFELTTEGKAENCTVEDRTNVPASVQPCERAATFEADPFIGADGKPRRARLTIRSSLEVEPLPASPAN